MEAIAFDTGRMRARLYHPADFEFVRAVMADEQVMQYIRPATDDRAIVKERTDFWLEYAAENPGLGIFMITLVETGEMAGYCVVRRVEYAVDRDLEVGYVLNSKCWGRGLATEITRGMIQYAVQLFNPGLLLAYTDSSNAASNRVLEKCGFVRNGTENVYQSENVRWELKR